MKRAITVLAVLLMAATTYTQTSRRTANTNSSARSERNSTQVDQNRNTSTRSSSSTVNANRSTTKSTQANRSSNNNENRNSYERNNNHSNANRQSVEPKTQRNSTVTRTTTTTTTNRRPETTTTNRTTTTTTNRPHHDVNRTSTTTNRPHHDVNRTSTTNSSRTSANTRPANSVNRTTTVHTAPKVSYHERYPETRYTTTRVYRGNHTATHTHNYKPYTKTYREVHYVYREPVHVHVVWTRSLHRHYVNMYPHIVHWDYRYGYNIDNVSAYYADYYIGDVKTVYGLVKEVFYSRESDEFFLYVGDYYPYHDFTIVLPGYIARDVTRRPIAYYTNQYINVTGLITAFEGKPEIVVKRRFQLDVY